MSSLLSAVECIEFSKHLLKFDYQIFTYESRIIMNKITIYLCILVAAMFPTQIQLNSNKLKKYQQSGADTDNRSGQQ